MQTTRYLPLFPLHTVLFPGVVLPVRVFEERYKVMVKRCLAEDRALGIVLIRSGSEVGAPAEPFGVGTLARIIRVDGRSDGTINLALVGERRFRIRSLVEGAPYAIGDVELLDDDPLDASEPLVAKVQSLFTDYVQTLRQLARQTESNVRIPEGAIELSYSVAANAQISRREQQALLEDAPTRRLQHEAAVLRRELALLHQIGAVTARRVPTKGEFSLN